MTALVESSLYNSLPSLQDAEASKQRPSVLDVMNGPIRNVFIQHGAETDFSLYLQHAHHYIRDGEAVVKVEGTAHRMNRQVQTQLVAFGNKIVPTTWMTHDDKITPMEFSVVPPGVSLPAPSQQFLADLAAVLKEHNCSGLFGLDSMAKTDWVETHIGEASVVVPSDGNDNYDKRKFADVSFVFEKATPGFRVHGRCGKGQHKHSSKPPPPPPPPPKPKPKPT